MKSDETMLRVLPRRPVYWCAPGQVSWLSDRPPPRAFPASRPVALRRVSSPITVTGSRRPSTAFPGPFGASRGANNAQTVAESRALRNARGRRSGGPEPRRAGPRCTGACYVCRQGGADMEMERRDFLKLTAGALTYALATESTWAQTAKVEVQWLGQASTRLTTLTGKVIVIDPFLTNNPKTPPQYKNLDALGKVDVILVTHGHGDHTGDGKELAARTGAPVLGPAGLIAPMIDLGWVAPEKGVRFGTGGRVNPHGPPVTITHARPAHSPAGTGVGPAPQQSTHD